MSLIDRLIEQTKDYISFKDLLLHLSGFNSQPVYEVVTYLLHHDLPDIDFYYIDTDYKIIPADFNDKSITNFLNNIQASLIFAADNWIFHNGESLEQLSDDVRRQITKYCFDNIHAFFKKSDLLSFEPLNGLLHFNPESIADTNSSSDSVEQQLADALAKIDELEQSKADGSFSMGTPAIAHGEPKTYEQLNNELAAANDKIANLKSQLEQSTTDKRLYTTPAMDIMDKVITEFWIDYDPSRPAPKQEIITIWITDNFNNISRALALNIDKVCRHSNAKSGGKYKR